MSSGKVHARVAGALLVPLSAAGVFLSATDLSFGAGWMAGALLGVLITPDIDQETTTLEEGRVYRLSFLLGLLWQWLWWPYAKVFRHRGISHVLIIGTATRFAYLNCVIIPAIWLWGIGASTWYCRSMQCAPIDFAVFPYPWTVYAGAFCAWAIQDGGHILFDYQKKAIRLARKSLWRVIVLAALSLAIWLLSR